MITDAQEYLFLQKELPFVNLAMAWAPKRTTFALYEKKGGIRHGEDEGRVSEQACDV
ncbi:MAG: hypothetical protein IJ169_00280 [Paludibacteraceae bacterium]|nr:hypothetical protein [Paludibacteraceae bacterium]